MILVSIFLIHMFQILFLRKHLNLIIILHELNIQGGRKMKKRLVKKSWCFAIILLFVGASLVSSVMSVNTLKTPTVVTMQNTWYVDDSGSNSNGGTSWSDAWRDINYAISQASNDDTIRVGDGTYDENVLVDKQLVIIGNGSDDTTINGNNLNFAISIIADNVVISEFTITNANITIILIDNSDSCNISNNVIYNDPTSGIGLRIRRGDSNIVFCNEFYHLIIGVQILNESINSNITYNHIHDNIYGIDLMHSTYSTIKRNDIEDSRSCGIWLGNSRWDIITENNFVQNPFFQAFFRDSYRINWNGNFWDNHPGGVFPKMILGWRTSPLPFFMIRFDWRPSKEKFDTTCP